MHAQPLRSYRLFVTPWTVAHQAPLSMGLSRQEYWSGLPCPPPGDLPHPGIEHVSLVSSALQADSLPLSHGGSLQPSYFIIIYVFLWTILSIFWKKTMWINLWYKNTLKYFCFYLFIVYRALLYTLCYSCFLPRCRQWGYSYVAKKWFPR